MERFFSADLNLFPVGLFLSPVGADLSPVSWILSPVGRDLSPVGLILSPVSSDLYPVAQNQSRSVNHTPLLAAFSWLKKI